MKRSRPAPAAGSSDDGRRSAAPNPVTDTAALAAAVLPSELIVHEVARHLTACELAPLKCVCRAWNRMLQPVQEQKKNAEFRLRLNSAQRRWYPPLDTLPRKTIPLLVRGVMQQLAKACPRRSSVQSTLSVIRLVQRNLARVDALSAAALRTMAETIAGLAPSDTYADDVSGFWTFLPLSCYGDLETLRVLAEYRPRMLSRAFLPLPEDLLLRAVANDPDLIVELDQRLPERVYAAAVAQRPALYHFVPVAARTAAVRAARTAAATHGDDAEHDHGSRRRG